MRERQVVFNLTTLCLGFCEFVSSIDFREIKLQSTFYEDLFMQEFLGHCQAYVRKGVYTYSDFYSAQILEAPSQDHLM